MRSPCSTRLLEASRREQEAVAEAADLPIFDGPVPIDPSLIDRAFERPPPEKLDVRCGLETHHEKILRLITITWHTPEALAYLRKLIVDERGNRAGFSPEVMSELLMLAGVLESVGPRDQDAWRANARVI